MIRSLYKTCWDSYLFRLIIVLALADGFLTYWFLVYDIEGNPLILRSALLLGDIPTVMLKTLGILFIATWTTARQGKAAMRYGTGLYCLVLIWNVVNLAMRGGGGGEIL